MSDWRLEERFLSISTNWVDLVGERYTDHNGQKLEYYRVKRSDSVIVLPVHGDSVLTAPPTFRPGIGDSSLDFPGGRIGDGSVEEAAHRVLSLELNLPAEALQEMEPMNLRGWPVDSSFSNQRLFGVIARLSRDHLPRETTGHSFPLTQQGKEDLLSRIDCAQCRLVLLHYLLVFQGPKLSDPALTAP